MSENDESLQPEEKGSSISQKVDSAKSNTKKLKDFMSKFKKSKVANKTLVKALAKVLVSAGWVILIFIIVVGIIMFFLTMPGMVMEKLKGLFKTMANGWNAWWGEDSATQFEDCQIYDVLNYLEEMGYDLKGYGFVTEFLIDPDSEYDAGGAEEVDREQRKSTADGVIRDGDNKVITGISEFINTYLISENYIYTIRNFNVNTDGPLGALWNHFQSLFSSSAALENRTGMLVFYHDTGKVGERDGLYTAGERGYIKFDTETKKLLIKKGWTNGAMEYSLDGWTGRYGMPVDFLLTIHLATQMPDLAYDMSTTFDTNVNLLLNSSEGTVYGAYKTDSEYVTYDMIMTAFGEINSTNWFVDIINGIDNSHISTEEITNIHALGIFPPNGCTCTKETVEATETTEATETITAVGDECEEYIKFIAKRMKKASDDSYKTYTPYIESVQNHWFRDVYFVEKSVNDAGKPVLGFVDYDYQYELITGERWTLYETDDNGDFIYYVMNEDGSTSDEIYTGKVVSGEIAVTDEDGNIQTDADGNTITERIANRGEDGTLVVKKAKTINLEEQYDDLGWNPGEWGSFIAYDPDIQDPTPSYDPMYSDDEIAEGENDLEKDAMKHMYIEIAITNVTQTGEGLRTETNPDIKKMFMSNNYFKYDGSRQRAEIIYALRKASGVEYGPIDDDKLEDTYNLTFPKAPEGKFTSEAEEGTYKLGDYVGNVSFQQDALNTFAMMENSHTLDSDYIYKDFKELVVELGYFDKEELTESKPKLLQWVVPEIGSGGYPDRAIDKRETEYGTMVHSKMDIEANKKNLIQELIKEGAARTDTDAPEGESSAELDEAHGISNDNVGSVNDNTFLSNTPRARLTTVGAIVDVSPAEVEEEDPPSGSDSKHVIDYTFNGIRYEGWKQTNSTCTLNAFAFMAAAYEGKSNQDYLTDASGNFCSLGSGVSNTYWNDSSYFQGFGTIDLPGTKYTTADTALEEAIAEAFSRSIPVYFFSGFKSTEGNHAVVLLGCDSSGKILYYNPGSGVIESWGDHASFKENLHQLVTEGANQQGGHLYSAFIPNEPPEGAKSSKGGQSYIGYEGNEAVVSPVTGILMEYGTYDAESAQENRENIDLKYGGLLEGKEYNTEEITVTDPETGETTTTTKILYPYDKVGYAVIKILDAETYKKLESTVTNKWKDDSLVKVNEKSENYEEVNKHVSFREATDELIAEERDWSKVEETVYGYKEFVEQYEQFGIGGYYIYIDGFKCETVGEAPEESEETETDENNNEEGGGSFIPEPGEPLTLDSFKISPDNIESDDFETDIESLYEPDEVSKLVSKDYTEKLKAESKIKADASIGITFSYEDIEVDAEGNSNSVTNEYILIKEGTLIGRTYTDLELLEERDGDYGTYDEYVEAQEAAISGDVDNEDSEQLENENTDDLDGLKTESVPLVGNYLRIIMQEQNGDIVENVEDYMKLDEVGAATQTDNFSIIGTVLSEDEWVEMAYKYATEHGCSSVFQNKDNLREYYNINVEKGVNPEYTFVRGIQESGLSDGASGGGINFWGYATPNGAALGQFGSWQEVLGLYCDTIVEYQDPTTWQYQKIMERNDERASCSENGGIDPLGFGDPTTVGGQQSLYSWLGDDHSADSPGAGGMYYLHPWHHGLTQYEGENKIIFESQAEFEQLCGSKHGTPGGTTSSTPTTVWEQGMYTAYQSRSIVKLAKDIFGEKAGTYAAR